MKDRIPLSVYLVILFIMAQTVGILILQEYIDFESTQGSGNTTLIESAYVVVPPKVENESLSFILIIVALIAGTALILLLIKLGRMLIWKLWFFLSVSIALVFAFYPFLLHVFSANVSLVIAIVIALTGAFFKIFRPVMFVHTFTELFMYGGLAALFVPIIDLTAAVSMLLILSVYDFYMVNKSGQMVTLAQAQLKHQVLAGLYVSRTNDLPKPVELGEGEQVEVKKGRSSQAMIGGGDIAFPMFFAGALMKANWVGISPFQTGIIAAICATLGIIMLFAFSRQQKFYPAIPFITAGCMMALGIMLALYT
ncbi:MAG TPA: presenilin family intramembrane aspartyl protease [Acidobacteriota bacterium]|nr:presenilin family intramembrane aspartyl protease [Acidobacteriota bacterium]